MAGYFPEELIEEIRISNDIVDVISEYVKLERKGKNYFGKCPFHNEKTASFSVEPTKQIYNCFGCGKGGNVIHFIMAIENLDFPEALRFLAQRAKIAIPENDDRGFDSEKAQLKKDLQRINVEAARFFHDNLINNKHQIAIDYFKRRRLKKQTIIKFGLGYAPSSYDALYKHLLSIGFNQSVILKSGLVIAKDNKVYDRFRGRVMFPIFDVRGNVIAFGGRVLDSSQPKYMNSPETEVYNKGRHLYAMNFAKNSCAKQIILAEGYMDVISLHQSGITNVVAPLGTALTENQGRLLKKYSEEIIISFDADSAGQAAANRGLDLLRDIGCNVRVLTIPSGKDPDEFIRTYGVDEFKKLVTRSETLIDYKFSALENTIDKSSSAGAVNFIDKALDILDKIDNNVERELYVKKLSKQFDISEQSIYSELAKKKRSSEVKQVKRAKNAILLDNKQHSPAMAKDNYNETLIRLQLMLLATICLDNNVYLQLKDRLHLDLFSNLDLKQAAKYAFDRIENKSGIVVAEIINQMSQNYTELFLNIVRTQTIFEDNRRAVLDILKKMQLCELEARRSEIAELKKRSDLEKGDVESLERELVQITLNITALKKN